MHVVLMYQLPKECLKSLNSYYHTYVTTNWSTAVGYIEKYIQPQVCTVFNSKSK